MTEGRPARRSRTCSETNSPTQLLAVEPGKWSGPLKSGYGMHLVLVRAREGEGRPDFEAVRDKVLAEWRRESEQKVSADYLARLREKYGVEFDDSVKAQLEPQPATDVPCNDAGTGSCLRLLACLLAVLARLRGAAAHEVAAGLSRYPRRNARRVQRAAQDADAGRRAAGPVRGIFRQGRDSHADGLAPDRRRHGADLADTRGRAAGGPGGVDRRTARPR